MTSDAARDRCRLLYSELCWLIRLRWAAGLVLLGVGIVNRLWLHEYGDTAMPAGLGAAVLGYNSVLVAIARSWPGLRRKYDELLLFGSAQLYLDLAAITLLAVWTGGLASPALGLFYLHMIFASLLQPRGRAYGAAVFAVSAMAAGLWAGGLWPATLNDWLVGAAWAGTMLVSVALAESVTRALYRRERARYRQLERVREMSARLRAQQQALAQTEKMAAMGQLAAGIAHEITNPLASMDSVLQLMQRNPGTARPGAVDALREQIQRMHRTVRQLTAFAHPGKGRTEIVPVNEVVRSALQILSLNHRLSSVALECTLPESIGSVRLNPHALQQVLANLVLNALDATAETPAPRIGIRTAKDDGWCVIEVSDNGSGIEAEHMPRIFEPFFTTKPIGQGTGLGLSICARLIRDQEGTLTVSSERGRGTTFTIRLPLPSLNGAPARRATEDHA